MYKVNKEAWFEMHLTRRQRYRALTALLLILLFTAAVFHFYLIPSWMGSYNEDCYLSEEKFQNLAFLLKHAILASQKYNLTYWLDYGTLLGAARLGSIIPWDGDGDISIIKPSDSFDAEPWVQELASKGIRANLMVARYRGMQVDIMRWKPDIGRYKGVNQTMLYKYYPSWSQDTFIVKLHHKWESFPENWIKNRRLVKFLGITAHVPNDIGQFLRHRFPWTSYINVPYKWKCWLPCWISGIKSEKCFKPIHKIIDADSRKK